MIELENFAPRAPRPRGKWPPPGAIAIACLLLLESGATAFSLLAMAQQHNGMAVPTAIAAMLLFLGGAGLLRQKRWGWALAMAAAMLTVCYALYLALALRTLALLFPAALHTVFFMYLLRPTVRERMR
jgi:hypothetical protein